MASEAAALLDELMGRSRNLDPAAPRPDVRWDTSEVCKYYLAGFCPHELFTNTRADLGVCEKIHDDLLKKEYEKNERYQKMGYEEDFLRFLQSLVSDVERRIRRGQSRLTLNNQQANMNQNPVAKNEKVKLLTERINDLVEQAEALGCEGKVEESQGVMKLCEKLKEERAQLENPDDFQMQQKLNDFQKEMEVCEVCGALLIVGDAPQRVDDHLTGKQHAGYARIRAHLELEKEKKKNEASEHEELIRKEREKREQEREKEREERRKKREKEDKERRDRRRSRSRSRDRRRRSRSRDRRRRSRSRDRRHSRSRERRRSRRSHSRDRQSSSRRHSRSRDRHRRSRSRGHKSRSRDRHSKDRKRSVSEEAKANKSIDNKEEHNPSTETKEENSDQNGLPSSVEGATNIEMEPEKTGTYGTVIETASVETKELVEGDSN